MKICAVEGCEKPVHARGWCHLHLQRFYRTGDPGDAGLVPQAVRNQRTGAALRAKYTAEEIAVFRWYSERLREDRFCFLRGPETIRE